MDEFKNYKTKQLAKLKKQIWSLGLGGQQEWQLINYVTQAYEQGFADALTKIDLDKS